MLNADLLVGSFIGGAVSVVIAALATRAQQRRWREKRIEGETWICHVCKDERDVSMFAMATCSEILPSGLSGTTTVRYCRDRKECEALAKEKAATDLELWKAHGGNEFLAQPGIVPWIKERLRG